MFIEYEITELNEFQEFANVLAINNDWWYRGVSDKNYSLQPSLERLTDKRANFISKNNKFNSFHPPKLIEIYMINQFKKNSKKLLNYPPKQEEHAEWVAIMQHYGAATRFLDFTTQFYTALFFALDDYCLNGNNDHYPAIYCINRKNLLLCNQQNSKNRILSTLHPYIDGDEIEIKEPLNQLLMKPIEDSDNIGIIPYQPFFKNDRMHIQDGLFLVPLNISLSFEHNLIYQYKKLDILTIKDIIEINTIQLNEIRKKIEEEKVSLLKITIDKKIKKDLYNQLIMLNKDHKNLYPDLQGIALYCKTPAVFMNKNILKELHFINEKEDPYTKAMKNFHRMINVTNRKSEEFKSLANETRILFNELINYWTNNYKHSMKFFNCCDNLIITDLFVLLNKLYDYDYDLLNEINFYYKGLKEFKPLDDDICIIISNQWYAMSQIFNDKKKKKECLTISLEYLDDKNPSIIKTSKFSRLTELVFLEENKQHQQNLLSDLINVTTDEFKISDWQNLLNIRLKISELSTTEQKKQDHLIEAKNLLDKYIDLNIDYIDDPDTIFKDHQILYSRFINKKSKNSIINDITWNCPKNKDSIDSTLYNFAEIYLTFSDIVEDIKEKHLYLKKAELYYKRIIKKIRNSFICI